MGFGRSFRGWSRRVLGSLPPACTACALAVSGKGDGDGQALLIEIRKSDDSGSPGEARTIAGGGMTHRRADAMSIAQARLHGEEGGGAGVGHDLVGLQGVGLLLVDLDAV